MKKKSDSVLITGVSTGIGYGTACELLARGYKVYGSVRSEKDAERLKGALGRNFIPLIFDVTNETEVKQVVTHAENKLGLSHLAGLINNAGIAIGGPLADMPMKSIRDQFEVNVFGLLHVTQAFLPYLGARENHPVLPGKIINVSSVAGKIGVPFLGAYSGSKFAVEGISNSLRRELQLYGIDVIIAGPGNVITPIWGKGVATEPFKNSKFYPAFKRFVDHSVQEAQKGYTVPGIGKELADIFEKDKPSTRYALVKARWKDWIIPRLMPHRTLDKVMGKGTGLIQN